MTKAFRVMLAIGLIAALILPVVAVPTVVEAQTIPTVITADAYIFYNAGENNLWVDIWCNPEDYAGSTSIYFQYRRVGDVDWIPGSTPVLISGNTMLWRLAVVPAAEYYDVRAVAVYNASFVYGNAIRLYSPTPASPYVSTGRAMWTSDTEAAVTVYGSPATYEWANLYVQYREQGETTWEETHKEYITEWADKTFDLTGLDHLVATEVRAALDYSTSTIYGETRLIEGTPDLECETEPSGAGTEANPYIITDICELNWMRNGLDAWYELGNDIDATMTREWDGGAGWTPVGQAAPHFTGHFDGKGFDISGLYIVREAEQYVGLFGVTDDDAVIRNIVLVSPYVQGLDNCGALLGRSAEASGTDIDNVHVTGGYVSGEQSVGGLVGYAWSASVTDCSYQGTVAQKELPTWIRGGQSIGGLVGFLVSSSVLRCFADVTITSESISENIGGLIGEIFTASNVQQSFSTGTVSVSWWWNYAVGYEWLAGGFTGNIVSNALVRDCYSRASVSVDTTLYGRMLGGFAGGIDGSTQAKDNLYSTGSVTGGTGTYKGGLVGYLAGGSVTDSFWDTQTSGQATSAAGTGKTTAQMKTQSTFTDAGWNFATIWGIDSAINDGYPHLQAMSYELDVDTNEPYWIGGTEIIAEGDITAADPNATTRGFVYLQGSSGTPTLADDWVQETGDFGTGVFRIAITGLTPETSYRVRAFADNGNLFVYGDTITVTTVAGPVVITNPAELMSWHSWRERRLHGFLQEDGGSGCSVRFEYGLDPHALNLATSWREYYPGVCPQRRYESGDEFYADILLAAGEVGDTYYFRAHAINTDDEEAWGEVRAFTLGEEDGLPLQVVTYATTERTHTTVLANGAITAADPDAFRRGFVYLTGGTGIPTVDDDVVQEAGTYGIGSFSLLITGLTGGNEYRVRAFAESDWGLAYGETVTVSAMGPPIVATRTPTDIGETSFRARGEVLETGASITRRGFVYMEGNSGTPTLSDTVVDETGTWETGLYSLVATGLTGGTYYRVRAFATNSIGTGYGGTVTVRTIGTPDVDTNAATNIGITTARLHGQVVDDGGSTCQWRLQWGIATGVYTEESAWTGALVSGQAFHVDVTELDPDTTYYFRAQTRNAVGLASGAELTFDTEDGVGDPSFLTATPLSGTEIGLVWLTGGGADNTQIQMQQNSYPASHLHGETVYYGNESATTVTGLTPGTTYYFRAWGEGDGTYSGNYTEDMATTLAGAPDDAWTDPEEPDGWFQTPDHTGLENFPLYDQVNNLFDSFGLPNTTGWVILSLILAAIIGMLALVLSNGNVWVAMAAGGGVLVFTTWIGLLMWWILLIYLVCVGLYAFIRSRV